MSRLGASLGLLLALAGGTLHAQPADPPLPGASPPQFRRIYVPAEEISKRQVSGKYLAVDSAEIEELLRAVHDGARGAPNVRLPRFEQAEYSAQLLEEDLLVGDATWQFTFPTQQPALLPLDPCSLALESPQWRGDSQRPAVVGTDAAGRTRVLIEGKRLAARWSQRGERTASGAVVFRLALPACPAARLTVDAPAGQEVAADHGIVTRATGPTPGLNRWTIELGGHDRVAVRLVPEEAARQRRPLTLLRQSLTYEFTPRGVNLAAQLRLDVHGEPLERVVLDLDPTLQLVAAQLGDAAVPWSATRDKQTGGQQAILEFANPVEGAGRVLQLSAVAPLASDGKSRLPGITPRGMAWQEGTAELLIPGTLELTRLETTGCRQSRVTALAAPRVGESIEIQYYRQDATIALQLGEPRERLALQVGSLVEVGGEAFISRMALGVQGPAGQAHRLQVPIRPGWTIDAVENLQSNAPLEWDIDDSPGRPSELKLRFTGTDRLVVRGRRKPPEAPTFGATHLQMLDLSEFNAARLISVRAGEGWDVRWIGEELKRRDPVSLDATQLQMFAQLPDSPVFTEDDGFAQAQLAVTRRKPNYAVDIHVDAAVDGNALTETCSIQCVPEASRIERLLVHFSEAREAPPDWSLAGGSSGEFSARKLSAAEQAQSGLPPDGEAWELLLQLERTGTFALRAQRTTPFLGETPLALVSVADATTQRGTLAVRALGETGLSIRNRRLQSVPAELSDADRIQTVRAMYHYQPATDGLGADAAVRIAPAAPQQADTGAWAWSCLLESRLAKEGVSLHRAAYRLQTGGRQQVKLALPAGARLLSAWLDASPLPLAVDAGASPDGNLTIDLASGRNRATLSVAYATPGELPVWGSQHAPLFPQLDVPVLARQWIVWLPPGYALADGAAGAASGSAELTWSRRLFGPLGRGPSDHVFNPLVAADWRDVFDGGHQQAAAREGATAFIESLGALAADYAQGEALTWGQVLALLNESESNSGRALILDASSLAEANLTPQAPLVVPGGANPRARGAAILREAHVVVVAAPGIALLTTVDGAAAIATIAPDGDGLQRVLADDRILGELRSVVRGLPSPVFETVDVWRAENRSASSAWTWPDAGPRPVSRLSGWSKTTLHCSPAAAPGVRVVHLKSMQSLAWAVFLAALAGGLWRRAKAPMLVATAAAAAGAALVVPAAYAPLASAALWGALLALALRMARVEPAPTADNDASRGSQRTRSSVVQPASIAILLASLVGAAAAIDAAEPPPATPKPAKVYEVIVPVDDQQRPVDGKYLVPVPLYELLHRQAAEYSGQPRGWLLNGASYQAALTRDPVTARLLLARLKARFELRVFRANEHVQLPLARESWSSMLVAARLDGQAIPIAWNDAGSALDLGPLAAEQYRLELDLRPVPSPNATAAGLELPIPRLVNSKLELELPSDAPPIEIAGARRRVLNASDGVVTAQLGPSDRLQLHWPAGGAAEAAPPNLEVEELIWVKVRPGTAVLEARFKYRVLAGRVRQLRILTDPRLSLLSAPATGFTVHTIPGDPQRIELDLGREIDGESTIDLSFLVNGTSGVGNLRLPQLESADARAGRRWLGVSVDPALQYRIQAGEDSRSLDVGEFTAAWGSSTRPDRAYAISRGEPIWVLSTRPSEPQTIVEQSLALGIGAGAARVQFDATLSIVGGVLVQLGIAVPPGISIDDVSLLEDEVQRVARWSLDADRVNIFLTAPIDGRQQLSLRGRWTPPADQRFDLPRLAVLAAEVKRNETYVYRQPAVRVDLEPGPGATPLPEAPLQRPDFGALAGAYAFEHEAAPVRVRRNPNNPTMQGVALVRLLPDGDRWMAELDYELAVADGLVDALRFEIPPQWTEPFQVDPPMSSELVSLPSEQRRQLILRPEKPLAETLRLRVRGRVASSPGDRLSVPDVLPLNVNQLDRFVALPQHLADRQQIAWDTLGLSPAKWPKQFADRQPEGAAVAVYQVAGERFQASLKAVERARPRARVAMVDLQLVWHPDGAYQAVAAFDLVPEGLTECTLQLPPQARLIHASVEQLPTQAVALANDRWRLSLGPQRLPQRLEVIYVGSLPASGQFHRFVAPELVGVEVGRTLWTVHGTPALGMPEPRQLRWQVLPLEHQLARLENVAALVELPAEVVGEHLPEEIARWYRPWRERYAATGEGLRRELIQARRHVTQSEESVAARQIDQRMRAVDERLGAARAAIEPRTSQARDEFAALARTFTAQAAYLTPGGSNTLELRYDRRAGQPLLGRLLAAVILVALGALAAWWLRGRRLPTLAPGVVAGIAGGLWWALLAPSFVGLVVLGAAAIGLGWFRWQAVSRAT